MRTTSFRLTDRDAELLAMLYGHRLVLARQLVGLGLFGSLVRCNARLRRLRETGLVRKAFAPSVKGTQAVHRVASKAAAIVAEHLGMETADVRRSSGKGFSLLQLEHCVQITDFRIQCETGPLSDEVATEWTPESLCRHEYSVRRGSGWQRKVVKPDGLLRLVHCGRYRIFFVEVDLGNVSHKRFASKVASYAQYSQGVFQQTYREDSFSVLVVTTGERRLARLAALVKNETPNFLFTTFGALRESGPFDRVWKQPKTDGLVPLFETEAAQ